MAVALANRVKVATATTGTGTVTLGAAVANNYCTFAEGGITNGQTVRYEIEDGTDFEIGTGVYTTAGTTLTRATVTLSKIGGTAGTTKITLSGSAVVSVVAAKEDFFYDGSTSTTAVLATGTIELGAASDTTLARTAAGRVTAEGVELLRPAVQADQETGTSNILGVTPGVQQFHQSAAKCWGFTTGGGTPVLNAQSYNMTSITDSGVGVLTVTIATDFSSASFVVVCTMTTPAASANRAVFTASKAAGVVVLGIDNFTDAPADPGTGYDWAMFGDLP